MGVVRLRTIKTASSTYRGHSAQRSHHPTLCVFLNLRKSVSTATGRRSARHETFEFFVVLLSHPGRLPLSTQRRAGAVAFGSVRGLSTRTRPFVPWPVMSFACQPSLSFTIFTVWPSRSQNICNVRHQNPCFRHMWRNGSAYALQFLYAV